MRAKRTKLTLSLLRAAEEEPGRPALIAAGDTVTFGELAAEVRSAVSALGRQGVDGRTPGVALRGESTRQTLVLVYTLIELGVPIVMVHPRSTEAERRRFLSDTGTETSVDPLELDIGPPGTESMPNAGIDDEKTLAVVQTSGPVGRPKGVALSRRAFRSAAAASAANLGWRDDDRWLLSLPVAHVGGLSIVTRCLAARRAVVVEPLPRFEARSVAGIVEGCRVTLLSLVPTTLARLLDLDGWLPPNRLRAILVGGAAASPALLARAADRGWPVLATYGLTEACSQVATQPYGTVNCGELGCGPPVAGIEVRIRGGRIEIRGPSLMTGYLPAGDEPAFDADGWLATGDLGELDGDGNLHVLGRADDVIVSGGENVHPQEVEQALCEHPAIAAACVFGVDDPGWGQAVAAALAAPSPPDDGELVRFLASRLAPYKRPRRVAYLDELPASANRKTDRARTVSFAEPRLRPLGSSVARPDRNR